MDLDELTIELAKSFRHFGLPPKLRYRLRRWLESVKSTALSSGRQAPQKQQLQQKQRQALVNTVKSEIISIVTERYKTTELKKNDMRASAYNNGTIKLDFGPEVPKEVKDAAMRWAKKRGLKAVESSLKKSKDSFESIVFMPVDKIEVDSIYQIKSIVYTVK